MWKVDLQIERAVANLLRSAEQSGGAQRLTFEACAGLAREELARWDWDHAPPDAAADVALPPPPDVPRILQLKLRSRCLMEQLADAYAWRRELCRDLAEQHARVRELQEQFQRLRRRTGELLARSRA